jgi:hypothetical protein
MSHLARSEPSLRCYQRLAVLASLLSDITRLHLLLLGTAACMQPGTSRKGWPAGLLSGATRAGELGPSDAHEGLSLVSGSAAPGPQFTCQKMLSGVKFKRHLASPTPSL